MAIRWEYHHFFYLGEPPASRTIIINIIIAVAAIVNGSICNNLAYLFISMYAILVYSNICSMFILHSGKVSIRQKYFVLDLFQFYGIYGTISYKLPPNLMRRRKYKSSVFFLSSLEGIILTESLNALKCKLDLMNFSGTKSLICLTVY